MAVSVDLSSPGNLNKEAFFTLMGSSPLISPSSDQRIWSDLRSRVDTLLGDRKRELNVGESDGGKRLKEDSLLLLRGFDSVAHTLSQLSSNLDSAIQGARDLAQPPTLTEMFCNKLEKERSKVRESEGEEDEEDAESKKNLKRKPENDTQESCEDPLDDSLRGKDQNPEDGNLKKAKKLATSMVTKAASVARELKSIKSDLSFMQDRCALLEEENRRLRDGFDKGIRPEDDDLVRLQLETLLAEKSRLASENATLTRENQCLKQLVEYHQLASQDLSPSYEQAMHETCLDLSPEEVVGEGSAEAAPKTQRTNIFGLSTSLDERFSAEKQ